MKIGVNARWLIKPFTGIGQYTENLFRELAKIDSGNEYVLVVPEEVDVKFGKNVRVEILKEKRLGTAGMKKTWWEQIQVPEFFLKEKVDVVFFTYPCNPWSGDWYKKGVKTIVTVHDCIPWVRKEYRRGVLSKMYHRQTRKAVGKADVVLTVSESSKKEIVKICDVGKGKVKVVYNDAGDVYKKSGRDDKKVLEKWGLKKDKYFLYVGGYDVRKNVEHLVHEYIQDYPLVLVGGALYKGGLYSDYRRCCEGCGGRESNIVKTGFLEEEELASLYRGCMAFVNLSKIEGFNIPLIEAANCGAPLILSNLRVHREIARDKAMFVDPRKDGALNKAVKKLLEKGVRGRWSKKSLELAGHYSWEKSAKKVKDMIL